MTEPVSPPAHRGTIDKGLKAGAIGLMSTIVIGVASTAPGYSLAAGLGYVTGAAGPQAPAIMWLAFVPMLFIAAAYYYLNHADPDCGTTFTWVTRAMGPRTGWISGWGIIMADLIIMPSLAQITGSYAFKLFNQEALSNNAVWTTVVGVLFIGAMTWICVVGIELNAKTQLFLLLAEIIILAVFAVVALYQVWVSKDPGTVTPSLSWINPFAIKDTTALSGGILLAVFLYWGWDTAVSVNEETKDSNRTPGIAAIVSTLILVGTYVIVAIAAQSVRGAQFLTDNSDDVLSTTGRIVLGSGIDKFLIIAVLTSAAASTQTTILPAARSSLSMAAHKAIPHWFGEVDPKRLSPAHSTIVFGVISSLWYIGLVVVSETSGGDVLGDSIAAVGLMIAFYYGMTGFACVLYYRKHLFTSLKNFIFVGLAPFLGSAILTWVFVKSCIDLAKPANSESGNSWFGVGPPLIIGLGLLVIGIPLMVMCMPKYREFFKLRRDPIDDRPSPQGGEAPPLGGIRVEDV